MIQEDFKDLFQQEIRNNPIVREVDQAQRRELRRSLLILIPFVAVLLFTVWQHHQLLQHGYRLEQLRQEQTRALEINRHLRLEIETLRAPARIERIATEQLHLVPPAADETMVIQRQGPTGERTN